MNMNKVTEVKEPRIKSLIYSAKGKQKTMNEFAAELGMSPAKLYRIAQDGFRKPISDKDLLAIAEHADEESGVTFGLLKIAAMQDEEAKHPERIETSRYDQSYWIRSARRAVMEALYAHNISFVDALNSEPGRFFDFAMNAQIKNAESTLFFEVKELKSPYHIERTIKECIGGFVLNGNEGAWNYIVFICNSEDLQAGIIDHLEEYLQRYHVAFNVSILFIEETQKQRYSIKELCLRPEAQIICFDY